MVPFGSIGITLFGIDLFVAAAGNAGPAAVGAFAFASDPAHWRLLADLALIGVFGGFYIVPLYALIQSRSDPAHRSRIIAANNILNAVFMVSAALIAIGMFEAGLTIPRITSYNVCYTKLLRMLFTGDHVMQGSTVVIGPPDGSMQAYLDSLEALLGEDVAVFAPGHGYLIGEPHKEVRRLIAHRLAREAKVTVV